MIREFNYLITEEHSGIPIGKFLQLNAYSRQVIIHLKQTPNGICINGEWQRINYILCAGDTLNICIQEETSSPAIVPTPLPLTIVYEDEDILVVNKPADMPVHPSQNNYDNTLANAVAYYYQSQGIPFVFRCINRLDRDTTGLTLLAKNLLSSCILSGMMKERGIHREYLAIASGQVPCSGTISLPIGRMEGSTIERCIDPLSGESAITHYTCLASNAYYSLVQITLDTGRTHQIRVHMKAIGHPLPGDYIYNPDYSMIHRQALHSHRLCFLHPIQKVPLRFEAPLPLDMKLFCLND